MFVAQVLYFVGVQAANMTTIAYTMLAFPFISMRIPIALHIFANALARLMFLMAALAL